MTEKRYLMDPTSESVMVLTALSSGPQPIARFAATYFHPQGGGQPADAGTLAGTAVIDVVHAAGGMIDHYLLGIDGLRVGKAYPFEVDHVRRYRHSRYHSAGHLIAGICETLFHGVKATTGHHWPGEARVDFAGDRLERIGAGIDIVQSHLRAAIADRLDIVAIADTATIRSIRIGGYEPIACGGTHVRSTSDIGAIVIRSVKIRKGILKIGYDIDA